MPERPANSPHLFATAYERLTDGGVIWFYSRRTTTPVRNFLRRADQL